MDDDIAAYLAKPSESLLTAESEFAHDRDNSCANRCYYACFQAAIAALLREGIRASGGQWGHDFVQAQFAGQVINRRKRYSGDLRTVLADNQILRDQADSQPENVTKSHASRALRKARTFVDAIH
jgi:uncharacterized protein (UPF0332 family)